MAFRTLFKGGATTVIGFIIICAMSLSPKPKEDLSKQDTFVDYSSMKYMETGRFNHERKLMSWNGPRTAQQQNVECRDVHKLPNATAKCNFVRANQDACENDDNFFNYTYFVYCVTANAVPLGMVILVLWWLFCFVGLAVTADDFFCPSLVVISKTLRLSPNVAGVTFLAFGNGAPDLFSAIAAISRGGSGMGLGGLFGAGMFVTTIVVGTIATIRPFKAMERPFLRDVIFYLVGVYWAFLCMWREKIYLAEAIGLILLYAIYVVVVVVSGYIYRKQKEREEAKGAGAGDKGAVLQKMTPLDDSDVNRRISLSPGVVNAGFTPDVATNRKVSLDETLAIKANGTPSPNTEPPQEMEKVLSPETDIKLSKEEEAAVEAEEEPKSQFRQFLDKINPINVEEWSDMKFYAKFYEIFKCPIVFVINLTCPVVDYDDEELNNWNRFLNTFQCFVAPTVASLLMQQHNAMIGGRFPVYGLTLILGAVLAAVVFFTSKSDKKPVYHWAFGYMGFIMSMVWIYVIANEIVALLETFGIVFNISNAILGLTLLAWGNSIGDWIANTVMARQGYARMGFAACYGAPFFNLMLGLGIPYLIRMGRSRVTEIAIPLTAVQLVLAGFLLGNLVITLAILLVTKFKAHRPFGVYLLIYYIIFLVIAILTETNVIPKNFTKPVDP